MKDGFTYRGTEFDASGGSFMIDVHPRNRLTRAICRTPPPHGVIEGEHAVRAGRILQQALLGIVRPTDLVLVVEVAAYNSPAKNRGRLCVKIAVDWNALHFATTATKDDQITLDLTRDQVKAAPEYKEGRPLVVIGTTESLPPSYPASK